MIIKVTKTSLKSLEEAMVKSLPFADYNSECFSSSDIARAQAVCEDLTRIFEILKENNINILECFSSESIEKLSAFYEKSDFTNIKTPKQFGILIPSDSIWRFSDKLTKYKHSEDTFVKIENDYFCKYWTDISVNSLYDIKPTMEALNTFAEVNGKLNKALDLITSELNSCDINRIRAIDCGNSGIELEICYSIENIQCTLFMYEDSERADIVITENQIPVKIYPLDKENKFSLFFENDAFLNRYKELISEEERLNNLSKKIWNEKLNKVKSNEEMFSNSKVGSIEKDIYNYVKIENSINILKREVNELENNNKEFFDKTKEEQKEYINYYYSEYTDEELKSLFIDSANENIYYMSEDLSDKYYDILTKIYNNLSTDEFRGDLAGIYKQKKYALAQDMKIEHNINSALDTDFRNAEKYCNIEFKL